MTHLGSQGQEMGADLLQQFMSHLEALLCFA